MVSEPLFSMYDAEELDAVSAEEAGRHAEMNKNMKAVKNRRDGFIASNYSRKFSRFSDDS